MKEEYYYYAFIAFIALRFFLSGIFSALHTIIVFSIPFGYIVLKKHYHIFKFEINDTLQGVLFDSLFAFVFCVIIIFGSIYLGNINWIRIFDFSSNFIMLLFLISFNYEILVRYFLQGFFERRFGEIFAIPLASLCGALLFLPDFFSAISFFIAGLFFGFIFSKTNDIYGATIGGFIIRVGLAALA